MNFDWNFAEICTLWSNWQVCIGSGNGLAPVRQQIIIWTIDGMVYWRIYASLGLNELKRISPLCRIYASVTFVSISSDNGLSPDRRQAITWTNAG